MRFTPSGSAASVISSAGSGLVASLALRLSTELFAAGPTACGIGAAVAAVALVPRPPSSRAAAWMAAFAALLFLSTGPAARGMAWIGGYSTLPVLAALYGGALTFALGGALRVGAARGRGAGLLIAALALLSGAWMPTTVLFGGAAALALTTMLLRRAAHPVPAPEASGLRRELVGATLALPPLFLGLFGWTLGRAALDPSALGFTALLAGGLVGAACAFGAWAALPGALVTALTAWGAAERLPDLLARGPHAGTLLLAAFGIGIGLMVGSARPTGRALAPLAALATGLLVPALAALPDAVIERAARAETAAFAIRTRVEALRTRAPVVAANLGGAGSTALRRTEDGVVAELDGTLADPDTRAGGAERFAGTLAGCATVGRGRVRVGGDDLGLAVASLRAQGFLAVDTAVPDAVLTRALAEERPGVARAWLHPSVRLVSLPSPAVLRAGARADALVEIVRVPFTDGRHTLPRARDLAASRAGLSAQGVHVLALAATGLPDGALLAVIDDFLDVYPGASLWLPPEGADTALLVGTVAGAPLPWTGIERCVAADRAALRGVSIRSAVDLGALALADADALAALPKGRALGPGLPATLHAQPALALAALPALTAAPERLFTGAPPDLGARAESRALFLELLREATKGDVKDAIARARDLAAAPGGARALEPVLKPHLDRARQAMARGAREGIGSKAWEEAEAALGTARALAPEHATTRCLEGELAGARGQLSRSEEAFAACALADPDSLTGHDGLARARRSRGNLTGAEEALRAALRARPDAWTTSHNLGVFLFELGRYDESERLLKQAMAAQARTDDVAAPAPYLALARLYLATERAELALAQAERAYGLGGGADALAIRGAARFELRQPAIAEDDFRAALALKPDHVLALGGLGQLQATRGEYELAAASFRAALEADPQNRAARENLGRLGRLIQDEAN